MTTFDSKALNRWEKSANSYNYYVNYLDSKKDKFSLSILDLIFISNFKGGSAAINEPEHLLIKKLKKYEVGLHRLSTKFKNKKLSEISPEELKILIDECNSFLMLSAPGKLNSKIDGFGPSYSSTILHFFFPELLPILDRRALNGADIEGVTITKSTGQVKDIEKYYSKLLTFFNNMLKKNPEKTVRDLDKELFIKPLQGIFKNKK